MSVRPPQSHLTGILMVAGSAAAYSTAGLFTRLIPLDVWTLLLWRGVVAGVTIAALAAVQSRGRLWRSVRGVGWTGVAVAVLSAASSVLYLAAFRNTSVADVSVIYAAAPLLTAWLGWMILRERPGWRVLAASIAALAGVIVMVEGSAGERHLAGDALALGMTLGMALTMVLIRRVRQVSMLLPVALSCFLAAIAAAPFAATPPRGAAQVVELLLFGTTQLGAGLVLLTIGTRRVPATQAALIGALDAPLAPLWVWLAFAEAPSAATLAGGAIVMAAVMWTMAARRRPAGQPRSSQARNTSVSHAP